MKEIATTDHRFIKSGDDIYSSIATHFSCFRNEPHAIKQTRNYLFELESTRSLITEVYAAFNRRDIDGALALMSEQVDWPKASEGGRILGKDEIRAYWTRQWAEFDPHVEPLESKAETNGTTAVKVHQLVEDRHGVVLSDQVVGHTFTITDGLIQRMSISEDKPAFGR